MGLFGGDKIYVGPDPLSDAVVSESEKQARRLTAATPQELALMEKLGISAEQADQGMLDQIRALGQRGEDLSNVDEEYMRRAYQPAFERLMTDYDQLDQGILENMNKRGVMSGPGAGSEPEAYQRSLLSRDTKRTLGQTMLEAQNQAVQQKLAQYNARLAEPTLATNRYAQTMTPYQNFTITPESERMGQRVGAAGNIYNAKLGYAAAANNANTQLRMSQNQNLMNMIGGGMGVASSLIGMSDPSLKKDRQPGPDPEQDLAELTDTPIDRWKYRWENDSVPHHEGAMFDEAPQDVQVPRSEGSPGGLDIPSYLGKLTNAVKALNHKMSAYERLQMGGA